MIDLKSFFKGLGYNIDATDEISQYIEDWKSWYKGNVASFHNYTIYNGNNRVQLKKQSLGMAKQVCVDFASYLLNEKVSFNMSDENTNRIVNDVLDMNSFYVLCNQAIEKSYALGTGAFVLGLNDLVLDTNTGMIDTNGATLKINFATADKIIPLSYDEHGIKDCAFAVNKTIEGRKVLEISIHKMVDGRYIIENYLLEQNKGSKATYTDISNEMSDNLRVFDTRADYKWFFIVKPNICNNIIETSPYGISIYANAINELKTVDTIYDSFVNEFRLGKKRIFIREDLMKYDEFGQKLVFDTNDIVFHQLPSGDMDGAQNGITESNMALRMGEHISGLQTSLNLLSRKVGMGNYNYKFDNDNVTTATQVISENSDLFKSIKKHEIILEDVLTDMMKSIIYICNQFLGLPTTIDDEVTIDFDDSIIEDKAEIKRQALLELNNGIIDVIEYLKITRNYTEEQAMEYVSKLRDRNPQQEQIEEE